METFGMFIFIGFIIFLIHTLTKDYEHKNNFYIKKTHKKDDILRTEKNSINTSSPLTFINRDPQQYQNSLNSKETDQINYLDHSDQIKILHNSSIGVKSILNLNERKIFFEIVKILRSDFNNKFFCYPQVSLGEILTYGEDTKPAINSKRVDFCICDSQFRPCLVIEYHGSGHFQSNATERDAVKEFACQKAGVGYIAVYESAEVPEKLRSILN